MARGQWSEVEARGVLDAWRRTGLSLQRYARQRGIVPQRLHWWKRKLSAVETANAAEPEPVLLPVRVKSESRRGEPVTVLLRTGHMLRLSGGGAGNRKQEESQQKAHVPARIWTSASTPTSRLEPKLACQNRNRRKESTRPRTHSLLRR
ncbi:IS66 family insertion sequence element accessory protein TnpA [Labilithrix luteola]|uniref:IS66 family insertion sequence element accessory protein TnpA n=1 Tax=Labilithrix luteola TaxID=1391654 RepID=UPI0026CBE705